MKAAVLIVGALVALFGLHWIGQETGYFPWPRNPVMDDKIVKAPTRGYGLGSARFAGAELCTRSSDAVFRNLYHIVPPLLFGIH